MPKKVPAHLVEKAGKCIFCGGTGLTHTHIWPAWLGNLLPSNERQIQLEVPVHLSPTHAEMARSVKKRQGGLFSQKPRLTCDVCNTGWMNAFEEDVINFAKPIFGTRDPVNITEDQVKSLAGWLSLVAVLAEYIDPTNSSVTVSRNERRHIREYKEPPFNWNIFAITLEADDWKLKYRHHTSKIFPITSELQYHSDYAKFSSLAPNSQLASFGMGNVFVQVFTSPNPRLNDAHRASAENIGMVQLWPPKPPRLFKRKRLLKFPTELVSNDEMADELADSFSSWITKVSQPPFLSGKLGF